MEPTRAYRLYQRETLGRELRLGILDGFTELPVLEAERSFRPDPRPPSTLNREICARVHSERTLTFDIVPGNSTFNSTGQLGLDFMSVST